MSTILAALRRAEQERRRQPSGEPLLPTLPGGLLLSADSAASAALAQRQRRYQRLGLRLLLLLLGASGMWLGLRYSIGPDIRTPQVSTSSVSSVERQIPPIANTHAQPASAPTASTLPKAEDHLVQPQVLSFPRLETERISAEQLASALSPERESWALPPSIAGIALDDNLITAADILPTPPLPTDPVRRPPAANSDVSGLAVSEVVSRGLADTDTALTPPDKLDLRGVSPELAQAFRAALQDKSGSITSSGTARSGSAMPVTRSEITAPTSPTVSTKKDASAKGLPQLRHLPAAQRALIPSLRFEVHNYVSAPDKRWVRINGQVYRSGAQLAKGVQLLRIEPEQIVLAVKGQQAALPALQDWPGSRG
ncbi:general secretion pathway protein GspB [Plesiomonas shigelloides]|uniref:general secretion pathway protein GspB n=1 Tax=Plesiomonas shigelloides TaxID=703 RepID=UPI002246E1B9|nr:general secretion pathway protein GspB [Plesiomonas shigelloides]MCX2533503.1 general secretion pathway protein GspB [Plesiomonas shigelloides]